MAVVPRIRQPGSAMSAVRQPARQASASDFSMSRGGLLQPETFAQQHGERKDLPGGIGRVRAGEVVRAPWLVW